VVKGKSEGQGQQHLSIWSDNIWQIVQRGADLQADDSVNGFWETEDPSVFSATWTEGVDAEGPHQADSASRNAANVRAYHSSLIKLIDFLIILKVLIVISNDFILYKL